MIESASKPIAEYDPIAESYAKLNAKRPLYQFAVYPSLFREANDIGGKDALDLACGEGIISRALKRMGARKVVGVDLSPKAVQLAQERERAAPSGIEYRQGRVGVLGKIGDFDMVMGGFLLHYAKTYAQLYGMCADAYENLRPGGTFISVNSNSLFPTGAHPKYENDIVTAMGELRDGTELQVSFGSEGERVEFKNYYWTRETYERALREVGFTDIEWLPITPTQEGIAAQGPEFWEEFLEKPFFVIVRARKPEAV